MSNFAEHRQGCPALPGYGHAPEPCTCGAMTAETELLPLYAELQGHPKIEIIKHYARANVARATAPLQAEIEALRAEVERVTCELMDATTRADKLEEAIKAYKSECDNPAKDYVLRAKRRDEMFALLRDQEEGNGQ